MRFGKCRRALRFARPQRLNTQGVLEETAFTSCHCALTITSSPLSNGVCDTALGTCACDAGWTSGIDGVLGVSALPFCSFLDFAPSPASPCGPACAFHGGPSSLNTNWTSWGMSVVDVGGTYHGFVAEMANECGLSAWTKGSQVVHVSAASPLGPFTRSPAPDSVVVNPWSHNPEAIKAPDGTFVIFTLGDGWAQNGAPLNCTHAAEKAQPPPQERTAPPLRGLGNCTRLAEPANCNPNPCWSCNITLHYSATPDAAGPWASHTTQLIGLSDFDNIGNWNPSPLVLPNGSIAVMIHTDDNNGWSGETIAVAPTWQGPYTVTVGNENVNNEPLKQEDPFMWIDGVRGKG